MKYKEFLNIIKNSSLEDWIYIEYYDRYIYIHDLDIAIVAEDSTKKYSCPKWTQLYNNPLSFYQRYTFQYKNQPIYGFDTVNVNDNMYIIPNPNKWYDVLYIDSFQYAVGCILNMDKTDLNRALDIAGIEVRH